MEYELQVETALSVDEAVRKMEKKRFDVVICDYQMPGKNGLELLKDLRDKGDNIPFILFTGKGREEVAIEALNLGADYYISKTGDPETVYSELAHSIRQAVKRMNAERRIKESEEKYRNLFENAKDVAITIDLKGKITSINKAAEEYGFRKEEVVGKNQLSFVPKKYWPRLLKELGQIAQGETIENEVEIYTPKGKRIAEYRSAPIIIDKKVVGVQIILTDVTDNKKILEELKSSEERFKILFEFAPDAYYLNDLKGNFIDGNKAAEELTGYKREELVRRNFLKMKLLSRLQIPKAAKLLTKNAFGKPTGPDEFVLNRKDGTQVPVEIRTFPVKIKDQTLVLGIARDVTKRKEAEKALAKSKERFRILLEDAPIVICKINLEGKITYVNKRFEEATGYSREEIVGKNGFKLGIMSDDTLKLLAKRMQARLMGKPSRLLEGRFKRKDGEWIWAEIEGKVIKKFGIPTGFQLAARDITERKRAEQAIKESQEKFERLFMNNPEAAVYTDSNLQILDINPRFTKLFGYSLNEAKGKHINDIVVPKDKIEEAGMFDKRASKGETYHEDTVRKRKDGTLVPVSISAAPLIVENKVIGHIGVYKDISQLKKTEKTLKETLEKLEAMNEKLSVVGSLTRHDIRNKLSVITGNLYLYKKKMTYDHNALKYLAEIESSCRHIERLLDFAGTYEQLGAEELAYINVGKCIEEANSLFSDISSVKLVNSCQRLIVLADSLLRQLFYNLIDNSLKHGEKVSQIRIYYKKGEEDKLDLLYEDDGIGISKDEKEKIFKEGYGKGTGYGLYLIRKMCDVYGWTVKETGRQGKGAQFTMTIPQMNKDGNTNYRIVSP